MCRIDGGWRPSCSCCEQGANGRRWMRLILAQARPPTAASKSGSGLGSSTGSGEWPPAVTMKCKGSTGVGFLSMGLAALPALA